MSNAYIDTNSTSEVTAPGTLTDNAVILGAGSKSIEAGPVLTNGQLLSGVSSSEPIGLTAWMQAGLSCWFWNLSFSHSAGTLTIAGANGTALSAANPGYLVMPSNANVGQLVQFVLTSNVTLTVSDMTGALFNMPTGETHSSSFPMYVGFMADASDANLVGVISTLPSARFSPSVSTEIGDPTAPGQANKDYSVFSFSDITEANYTDKAVGYIGSLTATRNSSDEYTLDALSAVYDGVGRFQEGRRFTYPAGTFGAGSGSYIRANGGTAPVFTTQEVGYNLSTDGYLDLTWHLNGDGGTDGAGAVDSLFAAPYSIDDTTIDRISVGNGFGNSVGTGAVQVAGIIFTGTSTSGIYGVFSGGSNFQNDDFANGSRRWVCNATYFVGTGR